MIDSKLTCFGIILILSDEDFKILFGIVNWILLLATSFSYSFFGSISVSGEGSLILKGF